MEWSGDWSDSSPLWTPALKRELGPQFSEFKDDGTFWMSFQDMVRHFMSINVCQVFDVELSSMAIGALSWHSPETMA